MDDVQDLLSRLVDSPSFKNKFRFGMRREMIWKKFAVLDGVRNDLDRAGYMFKRLQDEFR